MVINVGVWFVNVMAGLALCMVSKLSYRLLLIS